MKNKTIVALGYILIGLYFFQHIADIKWLWLEELQTDKTFKNWSGLTIFIYILIQWLLSIVRHVFKLTTEQCKPYIELHKYLGVFSPVVFYFHSTHPGYAFLFILTLVFFANSLIGLLNTKNNLIKSKPLYFLYIISHIVLSVCLLFLAFIHIWVVFSYN